MDDLSCSFLPTQIDFIGGNNIAEQKNTSGRTDFSEAIYRYGMKEDIVSRELDIGKIKTDREDEKKYMTLQSEKDDLDTNIGFGLKIYQEESNSVKETNNNKNRNDYFEIKYILK